MNKTALIAAALMVGGSAFAQTASTSDPYDTTPDTAVSADTMVNTDVDATADPMMDTTADVTMDATATGVGGPYVAPTQVTSKGGYPPCDPGPGDDLCIQLYEPGVSTSTNLAMNRNLGDGSTMMANADTTNWTNEVGATATGVGGPYEPVTSSTGAPYEAPIVREEGPTEASDVAGTDYPACEPGQGDDNCIQLYERGVMDDIQ